MQSDVTAVYVCYVRFPPPCVSVQRKMPRMLVCGSVLPGSLSMCRCMKVHNLSYIPKHTCTHTRMHTCTLSMCLIQHVQVYEGVYVGEVVPDQWNGATLAHTYKLLVSDEAFADGKVCTYAFSEECEGL